MAHVVKYAIGALLAIGGLGILLFIFMAGIMAAFLPGLRGVHLGLGLWVLLGIAGFGTFVTGKWMTRDNPLPRE